MPKKNDIINETITSLEKEELRLFHLYNRHGTTRFKLEILNKLIVVINKIEILKDIGDI
jgi:hypothetical protein